MRGIPNSRKLCGNLVSEHLVKTIAIRRKAWVSKFYYYFHKIGDDAKSLLAKHMLVENQEDKINALLGVKSHQKGTEPFFPSTSFRSGKHYDFSANTDKSKKIFTTKI